MTVKKLRERLSTWADDKEIKLLLGDKISNFFVIAMEEFVHNTTTLFIVEGEEDTPHLTVKDLRECLSEWSANQEVKLLIGNKTSDFTTAVLNEYRGSTSRLFIVQKG